MATNQHIQNTLRDEINTLPPAPSYTEMDRLPYLENFVKESMRIYSPGKTTTSNIISSMISNIITPAYLAL